VEAQITAESPVVGKELRELALPEGTSVAVILRGSRAVPARPETRLTDGDRMLAITSSEREPELRRLLIGDRPMAAAPPTGAGRQAEAFYGQLESAVGAAVVGASDALRLVADGPAR
jgi:NhaP-type Na+/H+ and K+/H+ antiporter